MISFMPSQKVQRRSTFNFGGSRDTQYWRDRWKARLDLPQGSRMQLKHHTYSILACELSPQIVWRPMCLCKIDQVYVRSSMECMWGALCDGYVGSSTVIFLTCPKDSMERHTISGDVCGAQLNFGPMSRAFHLSLLYYVSLGGRDARIPRRINSALLSSQHMLGEHYTGVSWAGARLARSVSNRSQKSCIAHAVHMSANEWDSGNFARSYHDCMFHSDSHAQLQKCAHVDFLFSLLLHILQNKTTRYQPTRTPYKLTIHDIIISLSGAYISRSKTGEYTYHQTSRTSTRAAKFSMIVCFLNRNIGELESVHDAFINFCVGVTYETVGRAICETQQKTFSNIHDLACSAPACYSHACLTMGVRAGGSWVGVHVLCYCTHFITSNVQNTFIHSMALIFKTYVVLWGKKKIL
jgi:hypothetical protein